MECIVQSQTAAETFIWGKKLSLLLSGGDLVCLYGNLGAGKTVFAQGVGAGLGITQPIISPTFTLIHEYNLPAINTAASRFVHMDLYRLEHLEEAEQIGVDDFLQTDTIVLIEWPEVAAGILPEDRLELHIEGNGEMPRRLVFRTSSSEWIRRLGNLSDF